MSGSVKIHRSTYDETGGTGFWGRIVVDAKKILDVPLEFARRGVDRTELLHDIVYRHEIEYDQRQRVAKAVWNVLTHRALDRSPPHPPEPSNNNWYEWFSGAGRTQAIINERDRALEQVRELETLGFELSKLRDEYAKEVEATVRRSEAAQKAVNHSIKAISGWFGWR